MDKDFKVPGIIKAESNLTDDQAKAASELIGFIGSAWSDLNFIHALVGAGGVGKTYTLKYVIENCKYSYSCIAAAAPTHKACRVLTTSLKNVIKAQTIQSMFGFRLDVNIENFDPENPAFNPIGRVKITDPSYNYKVLIVDEASMLNAKLVKYIVSKCKAAKIKIIFVGDSSQLPPVNEKKSTAFSIASKVNYLTQIVRQEDDNPIRDILSILRKDIDNRSYKFLEYICKNKQGVNEFGKGYIVCNNNDFQNLINTNFHDENYTKNVDMYKIIAYTNAKVKYWNDYIRNSIILNSEKGIITSNDLMMSYSTIVDDFNSELLINSEEYIIKDIGDWIDTDFGFKCFMVKFQAVHGGSVTPRLCVIDHTDRYTVQLFYKKISSLVEAAKEDKTKWKEYFKFKRKYLLATNIIDTMGYVRVSRDLDYGFALTSHKSQGSTYNTVFVDVNDIVFDKYGHPYTNQDELLRRLYVACSRASDKLILCYG